MNANQLSLYANDALSGFRLQRFELFNWGTFHQQVWEVELHGESALLTGENGSGKSTLVDGLVTLLVPTHKRGYNQAAGGSNRRERDEHSYVRGAYGKTQREDDYGSQSQTQYLRDTQNYSVLLGYFHNQALGRSVTLAQLFYYQNGLEKFFVVAQRELTIANDFFPVENISTLKRKLRHAGVEVFDQFKQYRMRFQRLFGLRSEKALELFSQAVMIKEIRRLTDFVRDHMLEKTNAQTRIRTLIESYENLTHAYEALRRAEDQLALLDPIVNDARKYQEATERLAATQACEKSIPFYFASRLCQLLSQEITCITNLCEENQQREAEGKLRLDDLRRQQQEIAVAIGQNEVGQQIQRLEVKLSNAKEHLQSRKRQADSYNKIAASLHLQPYQNEETFTANRLQAEALRPQIEGELDALDNKRATLRSQKDKLDEQHRIELQELTSLRQRQSQIPNENLQVRQRILEALGISEGEIPFIGELLRIEEGAEIWEGAIERLLHNFGLRLLVPTHHYMRVSRYVNQVNLRGQVVFHQVSSIRSPSQVRSDHPDLLIHKLQTKPGSEYADWIEHELAHHYDYLCCVEMEDFDRTVKAITPTGLQKSSNGRHEKDDRRPLNNPRYYVLGWDNADKIRAVEQSVAELNQQMQGLHHQIEKCNVEIKQLRGRQQNLEMLNSFADYSTIDWHSQELSIQQLQIQKERLEQSSDALRQLKDEQNQLKQQIQDKEKRLQEIIREGGGITTALAQHEKELRDNEAVLVAEDRALLVQHSPQLETILQSPLTLKNQIAQRRALEEHLRQQTQSLSKRRSTIQTDLVKAMTTYKVAYPEATVDFDASPQAIPSFERAYQQIKKDDLPSHRNRFKSLLNEKVVEGIVLLMAELDGYEESIKESIYTLNGALRTINYTDETYIQLQIEPTNDVEVRDFRNEIRNCLPDVGRSHSENDYEASFYPIQQLIKRFQEDLRWTEKVTDVRQWLNFAAVERYRQDNTQKEYYSDSVGKSGGQKAKLAYSILASAIAYQYGLKGEQEDPEVFRFVMIDEAFSRSDQENSRYAMSLFQKLDLQLLVVTPTTGINIVQPYITTCHIVSNNPEGKSSRITTIPLSQLLNHQ